MFRSYLHLPYLRIDEAKSFCRTNQIRRVQFDRTRKQWYYPDKSVPPALAALFPVVEVTYNGHTVAAAAAEPVPLFAYPPTPEQVQLVETEPDGAENLLVVRAFAGATKTTSLKAYARARPNARFLYLAFGNANAKEARESFPLNTECSTIHALAFRWLPPEYKEKVSDDLKSDRICQLLGYAPHAENLKTGSSIKSLLSGFWTSTDVMPGAHHLGHHGDLLMGTSWGLAHSLDEITEFARRLWRMMIEPTNPAPLTHEGYLKLYALSRPTLDYDYILLDEAQDTNPVTEEIVFSQKCKKIVVGDPHQNVFTFRRARDILTPRVEAGSPCLHLTNSFRFGPEIATLANIILQEFKGETHAVTGRGNTAQLLLPGSAHWTLRADGSFEPFTWISRSNASLFDAAVEINNILDAYENVVQAPAPKIAFVGTSPREKFSPFKTYKFGRLIDLVRLDSGEIDRIYDPFISRFKTLKELWSLVTQKETADPDLASAIRIYRRYGRALPYLVKKIGERCGDPASKDVMVRFTTAHKSKGLEWARVRLADDFAPLAKVNKNTQKYELPPPGEFDSEEINLLYVAATRAKTELELNASVAWFLHATHRINICADYMPGMIIDKRSPITWSQAVSSFGGDPISLRAELDARRAADLAQRAARTDSAASNHAA